MTLSSFDIGKLFRRDRGICSSEIWDII